MSDLDPRSWLDKLVGAALSLLVIGVAVYIAIGLIESVAVPLEIILGVTATLAVVVVASCAGAIPLDLLRTEQDRITRQLADIENQAVVTVETYEKARAQLADVLDFTRDCHAAYVAADEPTRRL